MWNNLSLTRKLTLGFVLSAAILTTLIVHDLWTLAALEDLQQESQQRSSELFAVTEGSLLGAHLYQVVAETVHTKDPGQIRDHWVSTRDELLSEFEKVRQAGKSEQAPQFIGQAETELVEVVRLFDEELIPSLDRADASTAVSRFGGQATPVVDRFVAGFRDFAAALNTADAEAEARFAQLTSRGRSMAIGLALLGLIGVAAVGFFTTRTIAGPVRLLVDRIEALSGGHISSRLKLNRRDEFGRIAASLDLFSDRMEALVFGLFDRLAEGKVDLETADQSANDEIAPRLRKLKGAIRGLTSEIRGLYEAALEGRLEYRADASKLQGEYSQMIRGVNDTLDALLAPVNEAAEVLERVAGRDLGARVTGDYKGGHARIKTSVNTAIQNLDDSLHQVSEGAQQVASAAQQIGSGSQGLAKSASEQAGTLQQIAGSLQEVSGMASTNVESAKQAKSLVEEAHTSSAQGVTNMTSLSAAMEKIKSSSDQTARIVKTIDEIAFQTNLLALNAAVEAARAGESGKGFAVVAEEVRSLAMRSAEAAKNTASLIEEAVHNAAEGFALNATVLSRLQEINRKVESASASMTEVAMASEQQREGVDQVNEAIEQMNQITQATAANAEESSSAAEELSSQAESMNSMVAGFKLSGRSSREARSSSGPSEPWSLPETEAEAREHDLRRFVGSRRQAKANGHSKKVPAEDFQLPNEPDDASLQRF